MAGTSGLGDVAFGVGEYKDLTSPTLLFIG